MIAGKLYRYKNIRTTLIIMENREWAHELQDIKMGDVLLCIEAQGVRRRLLDSNANIGWIVYSDCYDFWDEIS
jgi:hypothetical protein